MRVLVAGGSGVIGRQLVPLLASIGHEVVSLSRSPQRAVRNESSGARIVVADALDKAALTKAVGEVAPEAVVHLLTAIPATLNPRKLAGDFELTNRLRTEGTRNLIEAASGARVITQGLAYAYDPAPGLANEDSPLWQDPPTQFVPVLAALKDLEQQTAGAGGLVVRIGHLYGPGSAFAADGSFTDSVRKGKVPLVGGGTGVFSFTHARDAASAIAAALDKDVSGVLNVVDDDPAPVSEWLPVLASIVGGKAPAKAPALIARMAVGGWGVAYMTQLRGADNSRAKLALNWKPGYPSWRAGLAAELPAAAPAE